MNFSEVKKSLHGIILIGIFLLWTLIVFQFSPERIVQALGIENGYLIIFLLAMVGGLNMFTGIPYHLVLVTLGAGGLNPFLLGLSTGIGVMMGDSVSYLVGYHGREVLSPRFQALFGRVYTWALTQPSWRIPLMLFLYGSLIPLSNDVLVIPLGIAHYPYWKLMIPLGLGNIVFNTGAALLGAYGLAEFFQ